MTDRDREAFLAVVGADDWRVPIREQLGELRWGPDRLATAMCDETYYVTGKTVRSWLSGVEPKLDAIQRMVLALEKGRQGKWSKARYLSWLRVGDAIRPIPSPRKALRVGLLAAAVALFLLLPMTAEAQTILPWGPGGTLNGASSPVYTQPIRVIDAMAGTLSDAHRPIWVKARNQALANWQIPFTVERITEAQLPYPWTTENINSGMASADIRPNAILIVRDWSAPGQASAGWNAELQGGVVALGPWSPWWQSYWFPQLVGAIGHEVGHTLGFGHGGNGIMGGNLKPNAVELAAVHAYWG